MSIILKNPNGISRITPVTGIATGRTSPWGGDPAGQIHMSLRS